MLIYAHRNFSECVHDRQSDSDKKIHQGWGGDEGSAELKVEEQGAQDAVFEAPAADWGTDANANEDAWGVPAAPAESGEAKENTAPAENRVEEEDKTLTYDEYLAQQKEKASVGVPQLETRRANDGDDAFKDAVQITKDEEEEYFSGKVGGKS